MAKRRKAKQRTANAAVDTEAAERIFSDVQAAIARSHELDRLDVLSGKRKASSLHFISAEMARSSKPIFPKKYQKS